MKTRHHASLVVALLLAAVPAVAQTRPAPARRTPAVIAPKTTAAKPWMPPKLPWGDPDLQGQWPATANIPMQRPANLAARGTLSDEELAQREKQAQRQTEADSEEFAGDNTTVSINPPSYWVEHGKPHKQASL